MNKGKNFFSRKLLLKKLSFIHFYRIFKGLILACMEHNTEKINSLTEKRRQIR